MALNLIVIMGFVMVGMPCQMPVSFGIFCGSGVIGGLKSSRSRETPDAETLLHPAGIGKRIDWMNRSGLL